MKVEIGNNTIKIENAQNFDPKATLECGQIFRYNEIENGFEVFSLGKKATITKNGDSILIATDDTEYFANFFDLSTDYSLVAQQFFGICYVKEAYEFGKGIRILKQDTFEMILSFIISANNNIKRIRGIIERLCEAFGEKLDGYYAFPTKEQLKDADEEFFKKIGCGYRAGYLVETIKQINDGFDLKQLKEVDTPTCRKLLTSLKGVGPKVADCIMLFGVGRGDVFPVDTWTKKAYHLLFDKGHSLSQMPAYFVQVFGESSGKIQQYLFYFLRESKNLTKNFPKSIDKSVKKV